MSRFNLIDEPWIPVRFPAGRRVELGIRDTLLRSREITGIEDSSPLVVAALHRFLLALLYRALEGPTDTDQAKVIFQSGIPGDVVMAYLEKWRERFWLFDRAHPFGQNPNIPENKEPWTKLTADHNATSNKVLFDHTDTRSPGAKEPGMCARWLLSTMTFSIYGGRGYRPSPSANTVMCIPVGRTLRDTLLYNLVPYPNKAVMQADTALWEREPLGHPITPHKRPASGYADLYSWPARMILLEELPSGLISYVRFVAGQGFENPDGNPDPMCPYRQDKKLGRLPIQFKHDRATWRDFDSLLPDGGGQAPLTVQHAAQVAGCGSVALPEAVLVLGQKCKPLRANVDIWRMERYTLPEAVSGNRYIREEMRQLLSDSENAQKALWSACRSFASCLLSRGERDPAKDDIRGVVNQMGTTDRYWSALEPHFHDVLRAYTRDCDSEDLRWHWLMCVRDAMKGAWEEHSSSVAMGDVWSIRALVKGETRLLHGLMKLDAKIAELKP